jgi:hypothetical protein
MFEFSRPTAIILSTIVGIGCNAPQDVHRAVETREQACATCHGSAFATAVNPKHVGAFPETCGTCHNTSSWSPAALRDHPWYALDGKHQTAACEGCHTGSPAQYAGTPTTCAGCHRRAFETSTNPPHPGLLPDTCESCHRTSGWSPATVVDHPWFPLDGKHATAACASCHSGNPHKFVGLATTCVGCHLVDFQGAGFPGHGAFPQTCQDCHSPSGWAPAASHPEARFPIQTGSHANPSIACSDCHDATRGLPARGQNTDCIHCHLGEHTRPAVDAVHTALGAAYPGASAASPNFCLGCHPTG